MTFLELQNAGLSGRFKDGDRPDMKTWINTRAQRIWTAVRWQFQTSDLLALGPLVPGTSTFAFPATLRRVEHVYNELGDELTKLPYPEWQSRFRGDVVAGSRDRPSFFAVRNRTVYLGPVPSTNWTFYCDGLLVWGHADVAGAFVAGDMTLDTDKPYWPDNHHYLLVPGAKSLGMRLRSDPTYPPLEDEFTSLFTAMVDELAEDHGITSYAPIDPL